MWESRNLSTHTLKTIKIEIEIQMKNKIPNSMWSKEIALAKTIINKMSIKQI